MVRNLLLNAMKKLSEYEEHSSSFIIPRIYRGGLCFRDSNDGPYFSTMTAIITTNDGAIFFNEGVLEDFMCTKSFSFLPFF